MKLSNIFNEKVLKGAGAGAGIAFLAAILPGISISLPLMLIGAGIGGLIAHGRNDKKGPKPSC